MSLKTRQYGTTTTIKRDYPDDWDARRRRVYKRDNHSCQNCGRRGGRGGNQELHAHHIVPKSKGGTHQESNLITLCKDCHQAIHDNKTLAPTANVSPRWPPGLGLLSLATGLLLVVAIAGVIAALGGFVPSWVSPAGVATVVGIVFASGLYHLNETSRSILRSIKYTIRNW